METDKHYFVVGLFIIGIFIAAAAFAVWLQDAGRRDDIRYRINFAESVSGLALGDPVKYRGVDVGNVETIMINPSNNKLVQVDVSLRKEAPVKTDTKASLRLKGITGVMFIELAGENPNAPSLISATEPGKVPLIPSEKSALTTLVDQVPKTLKKIDDVAEQAKKLLAD